MKEIIQILMSRDGLTLAEAKQQLFYFCREMRQDIESGGSPFGWEERFESEFGLEPDYFESIIFSMC